MTDSIATVEAIVVGAGIAGTSVAAELSKTRRVVLVEREPQPAMHASGRSASVLSETSGHPVVCALARLSRPFFESPPDGFVPHPLLGRRGLVWVGESGDEPLLDELAERSRLVAQGSRRLSPAETHHLLPTFADRAIAGGAVYEPEAMTIDAAALIEAYVRQLRRNGGLLSTTSEAISIEPDRDEWIVVTPHSSWRAPIVVNASGGWADVVALRAGVDPLGLLAMRRTAAIAPAPNDVESWPLVMDIAGRYYCEPEPGGLLISPADETLVEPCDAQPDEIDVAIALERVSQACGLPLRSIRRAWAGLRTFAPDRVPVVGEDPEAPGFWWLVGQGGAGIKTAPAMADLLVRSLDRRQFPEQANQLGITPEALSPSRLR